jgi:hypothetical protein
VAAPLYAAGVLQSPTVIPFRRMAQEDGTDVESPLLPADNETFTEAKERTSKHTRCEGSPCSECARWLSDTQEDSFTANACHTLTGPLLQSSASLWWSSTPHSLSWDPFSHKVGLSTTSCYTIATHDRIQMAMKRRNDRDFVPRKRLKEMGVMLYAMHHCMPIRKCCT